MATANSAWVNRIVDFDIDVYLNPLVPPSFLGHLPTPVSRFLGHRGPNSKQDQTSHLTKWVWAFIGSFCSIALIAGVLKASPVIQQFNPPVIIGSFGAAAVLEFHAMDAPLAQPRNLVLGQTLSSVIGVAITKAFMLLPPARYLELDWLVGALCVATTIFVMAFTKTTYPPAGATALLAATSSDVIAVGWWLPPLTLISCLLMLATALLLNNIQRRFPIYWWTPADLRKARKGEDDIERIHPRPSEKPKAKIPSKEDAKTDKESLASDSSSDRWSGSDQDRIIITAKDIEVPEWLEITDWKREILEILRQKLVEHEG